MKRILLLFAALMSPAYGEVSPGALLSRDGVSAIITHFRCQSIPGVALAPSSDCKEGILVSIQTSDPDTLAYVVKIRYVGGDGNTETTSAVIARLPGPGNAFSSVGFPIGVRPIAALSITELKAARTAVMDRPQ